MMRVILLRHAQCEGKGYVGKRTDVPLTPEGTDRASEIAKELEPISFDKVFSSTMTRCRETIDPFTDAHPEIPVVYDERLAELDFGLFDGLSFDEIRARFPAKQQAWFDDLLHGAPPEGESLLSLHERVGSFLQEIMHPEPDSTILICAHGGSLRAVICVLLSLGVIGHWSFQIDRGNYSEIHMHDLFNTVLHSLNTKST